MATFTEESLDKLNKKQIISIALSCQKKLENTNTQLLDEMRKITESHKKMEVELGNAKEDILFLSKKLTETERHCWENSQYSRRECVDVVGLPTDVEDDALEKTVIALFGKIGWDISEGNIESCHRYNRHGNVIVKLSKRKDIQKILQNKKDLKSFRLSDIGLSGTSKVYINISLCPYYRKLWSKAKLLKSKGKIYSFHVSNGGTVKIKINEGSTAIPITHEDDFHVHFPGIDLSRPSLN